LPEKGTKMTKYKYIVLVDDNFHYMDESERYQSGEYENYAEAVTHCKKLVDEYLHEALRQGVANPENLYESYVNFGEDPFIQIHPGSQLKLFEGEHFSAWDYAKQSCEEYKQGKIPLPKVDRKHESETLDSQ
jgi:predicted nucleotidyltransferase